jgi:hypothetical protein
VAEMVDIFLFLLVMIATVCNYTIAIALPLNIRLAISIMLFIWPSYAGVLQMTVFYLLLNHLMKQYAKHVLQSPEASRKLMKSLKAMFYLNIAGLTIVGFGNINFLYSFISSISVQWNIIIMMFGFDVFFVMLTYLPIFMFDIKHVVAKDGSMLTSGMLSVSPTKPETFKESQK